MFLKSQEEMYSRTVIKARSEAANDLHHLMKNGTGGLNEEYKRMAQIRNAAKNRLGFVRFMIKHHPGNK